MPPSPLAPVVIASPDLAGSLEEGGTHVNAGYFALRRAVFRACYVERTLWDNVVRGGAAALLDSSEETQSNRRAGAE